MRTLNIIFVFGLIACSLAVESTFNQQYSTNAQFKEQVDALRTESNVGEIIMNMAELHLGTEAGRFAALFDAIDGLVNFLNKQIATENASYKAASAQHQADVLRLSGVRDRSQAQINAATVLLRSRLYPRRARLQNLIAYLSAQLAQLRKFKVWLINYRKAQIALYNSRNADYSNGLAAIAKALPLLQGLQNAQSFAEADADVFAQVTSELKEALGKFEYAQLYTAFVESMVQSLTSQNFVNQAGLRKVIALLKGLQERLRHGLVNLNNDEAQNAKNYNRTFNQLVSVIKQTKAALAANRARLARLQIRIANVRKHRQVQRAINAKAIRDLAAVEAAFKQRTRDHHRLLNHAARELALIAKARAALAAGGITRSS